MTQRRKPMQVSIEAIIEAAGRTEEFKRAIRNRGSFHLKLTNGNYQPLVIEVTHEGYVSLMHYYIQEGDVMRDPEIVFNPATWYGIEITQDMFARYQRLRPNQYSPGIEELARVWAKNLREQGWIEAAAEWKQQQEAARQPAPTPEPAPAPEPAQQPRQYNDKRALNKMLKELSKYLEDYFEERGEGGVCVPDSEQHMKAMRIICRKYVTAKEPVNA